MRLIVDMNLTPRWVPYQLDADFAQTEPASRQG